ATGAGVPQRRRSTSEIVRELKLLRASPLRFEEDDDLWTGGQNKPPPPDYPLERREQLEKLRLSRYRISMLLVRPAFEQAVSGCYARVNINGEDELPKFRIAEILGLEELDFGYKVDEIPTNMALRLRYEDVVALHEINDVSNLEFTNREFEFWQDNCINQAIDPPTTGLVARKKIELYNAMQCEAKALTVIRQNFVHTLKPTQKRGILERHGRAYPWRLKIVAPQIPKPQVTHPSVG
ncbi:hypothetical protein KR009_009814, partial [Drosophila setifemur]